MTASTLVGAQRTGSGYFPCPASRRLVRPWTAWIQVAARNLERKGGGGFSLSCVCVWGGGGGWHKASVSDGLPLAAPIGLSPLLILTLCGPERVWVVSTEPPDDLSCLTTPGVGCPGDRAVDQVHPDAYSESMLGLPTPALCVCVGVRGIPMRVCSG